VTPSGSNVASAPAFFRGGWIEPGHPGYAAAWPVFNQRVDAGPEVIARCAGTSDVVSALAYARQHGLRVEVRCTGLTFGRPAGGRRLVIDLSLMRGIQILPEQRIARIQGGVCGGDLQIEAALHGLGGATGALSMPGVGLMLAGGIGLLSPRVGYASDNIVSVELVTAAGEVVTASPEQNPDLFWAVRGSAGNFGVVTALEVRLHEVPSLVHAGMMSWSLDNLGAPVRALREWDWASDDLCLIGVLGSASLEGQGGLDLIVCHSGPADNARADLDHLRSFGAPDEESIEAIPFRDLHFRYADAYPPMRATMNEQTVGAFSDELVDALVTKVREPAGGGARFVEFVAHSGALGRAPELPSALRESAEEPTWGIGPGCWWEDEAEDANHDKWVQDVIDTIRRIGPATAHPHPNAVGVALDVDGVRRMYGDRFDRLRNLKRRWDPDNVFAGSHNIPPAQG
jgi:FAD/FMN-containing dehydrogenase